MYAHIRGTIDELNPTDVVIDCQGVGYLLNISLQTYSKIKDLKEVKLYTHFIVREDAQLLYGFFDQQERQAFVYLISVNGIGSNTARMILSSMTSNEVYQAILSGNVPAFKAVKGIGAKTAQRIIIDLKDKVGRESDGTEIPDSSYNTKAEEALSALVMLGFARNVANKALQKVIAQNGLGLSVEELIRLTLKQL
jgi:Holliday junction DNA helicase RuvA